MTMDDIIPRGPKWQAGYASNLDPKSIRAIKQRFYTEDSDLPPVIELILYALRCALRLLDVQQLPLKTWFLSANSRKGDTSTYRLRNSDASGGAWRIGEVAATQDS